MKMTDYIRIKYAGYYFEYTKYDVNPSVYYDKPVLDDIKEVLDKRAWNIQELNLCYINLRYEFSEYYDNDFETIRKELIELEEKLETEYRFQFGESGYFRLTPRNKYQEEPVYEEQMDEICTKCGRIIPRVERRIYIDRGLGVIQNGGRADEGAAVHRYCPYCEENGLISYANIYEVRATIEDNNMLEMANNNNYEAAIDSAYKAIDQYLKIDPFYEDLFESMHNKVGHVYSVLAEMRFDSEQLDGQRSIVQKAIYYLEKADKYKTLIEPHDLLRVYCMLAFSMARDPQVENTDADRVELNRIKDQLDLQAERSIYLYQNIPELPLEEYEKEETYCERQRILGRIMILATMDKFHYPIDEINSYIDNIESIIIDSKRISESDKQNYLTNLPDKYIEHTDKKGCYVATAVYGSYDCPEVWTLRRFRDEFLNKRRLGRLLVKIYYKISPRLILTFGSIKLIKNINRKILDKIVRKLNGRGYVNSKYIDQ